jgi:hypothetical protein
MASKSMISSSMSIKIMLKTMFGSETNFTIHLESETHPTKKGHEMKCDNFNRMHLDFYCCVDVMICAKCEISSNDDICGLNKSLKAFNLHHQEHSTTRYNTNCCIIKQKKKKLSPTLESYTNEFSKVFHCKFTAKKARV